MNTVEVLTIIGSVLVPMFGGFGWLILRMDKKFDILGTQIRTQGEQIHSQGERLARIEGMLYWFEKLMPTANDK